MPKTIISELVRYALWILGHSYDSGKCHATMFFGLSFQFKVMLDEFDAQDGLRKLYNVVSRQTYGITHKSLKFFLPLSSRYRS